MSKRQVHYYVLEGVTDEKVKVKANITTSDIFAHIKRYYDLDKYTDVLIEYDNKERGRTVLFAKSNGMIVTNASFLSTVKRVTLPTNEHTKPPYVNKHDKPFGTPQTLTKGDWVDDLPY